MCMINDVDKCVVLAEEKRKSRKSHQCYECGREIQPKELYLHESIVFDGSIKTHKTCAHCQVARNWLMDECNGWVYGFVEDDIREHVHERHYGMDLARVAVGMRRNWKTRKGKLMPVPQMPLTTHDRMKTKIGGG